MIIVFAKQPFPFSVVWPSDGQGVGKNKSWERGGKGTLASIPHESYSASTPNLREWTIIHLNDTKIPDLPSR